MNGAALTMTLLALLVAREFASSAAADQAYTVTGKDSFSIGAGEIHSEVTYAGTQTLALSRHGKTTRYAAHVAYTRSDGTASTGATGDYVADVLPSGDTLDSADHDPDYLTVLNQPFAARLDRQTLADLRRLKGPLPFDFPSPFTGSSLHGYLRHLGNGLIGPRRAIGVKFEAAGPMKGALPDRPGLTLAGTIAMRGSAYYDAADAILLTLDTTVTIVGTVSNRSSNDPVTIVYERKIHADVPPRAQGTQTP